MADVSGASVSQSENPFQRKCGELQQYIGNVQQCEQSDWQTIFDQMKAVDEDKNGEFSDEEIEKYLNATSDKQSDVYTLLEAYNQVSKEMESENETNYLDNLNELYEQYDTYGVDHGYITSDMITSRNLRYNDNGRGTDLYHDVAHNIRYGYGYTSDEMKAAYAKAFGFVDADGNYDEAKFESYLRSLADSNPALNATTLDGILSNLVNATIHGSGKINVPVSTGNSGQETYYFNLDNYAKLARKASESGDYTEATSKIAGDIAGLYGIEVYDRDNIQDNGDPEYSNEFKSLLQQMVEQNIDKFSGVEPKIDENSTVEDILKAMAQVACDGNSSNDILKTTYTPQSEIVEKTPAAETSVEVVVNDETYEKIRQDDYSDIEFDKMTAEQLLDIINACPGFLDTVFSANLNDENNSQFKEAVEALFEQAENDEELLGKLQEKFDGSCNELTDAFWDPTTLEQDKARQAQLQTMIENMLQYDKENKLELITNTNFDKIFLSKLSSKDYKSLGLENKIGMSYEVCTAFCQYVAGDQIEYAKLSGEDLFTLIDMMSQYQTAHPGAKATDFAGGDSGAIQKIIDKMVQAAIGNKNFNLKEAYENLKRLDANQEITVSNNFMATEIDNYGRWLNQSLLHHGAQMSQAGTISSAFIENPVSLPNGIKGYSTSSGEIYYIDGNGEYMIIKNGQFSPMNDEQKARYKAWLHY